MLDPRDDIIDRLKSSGLHGQKRDWSMGKSVIASRSIKDAIDGIKYFDGYICIYPIENEKWGHVVEMVNGEVFNTWLSAVERAIDILKLSDDDYQKLVKSYWKIIREQGSG